MIVALTVNGRSVQVHAEPDTPLLWIIRDNLGLTGTKFGCGAGLCGACTVHVNGQEMRSCQAPLQSVNGAKITTIEGLGTIEKPHPLQAAWIAEQVPQCGYCQSGMLMAAAALLQRTPSPSDADIDNSINNICRCGTYPRIRRAIHRASRA